MSRSSVEIFADGFEDRRLRTLAKARALREQSLIALRHLKIGTLNTVDALAVGVKLVSFSTQTLGVVALLLGTVVRPFNFDGATNFFAEVALVTGAIGFAASRVVEIGSRTLSKTVRRLSERESLLLPQRVL